MKIIRRGFDGLPPNILDIIPQSLRKVILILLQKIFFGKYPSEWKMQTLRAVIKPGHTFKDPQLRGIAPLLCRVYDTRIDSRFRCWYLPNPEQSGSRPNQGCLLPIFILVILINFCKDNGRNLFVGFLDFEKAFEYVNRAKLIKDLMNKGCGKAYVRALSVMNTESFYTPKISKNMSVLVPFIVWRNLFSFSVSDMPISLRNINSNDFFEPYNFKKKYNLIQLADETMIFAEFFETLRDCCNVHILMLSFKFQMWKRLILHILQKTQLQLQLHVKENTFISSIDERKGYVYLGMSLLPTNDFSKILIFNINDRMKHVAKLYALPR